MSIHTVFRGRLRSNFVLGVLLSPAVACSGGSQAANDTVGNTASDAGGGGVDANGDSTTPVIIEVKPPEASPSDGPAETSTQACPAGELACDGGCIANSISNCGSCGNECPVPANATATCTATGGVYSCGLACGSGYASCGGACVATSTFQSDNNNCGSCGHGCFGGTCSAGACQPWLFADEIIDGNEPSGLFPGTPVATDGVSVAYVQNVTVGSGSLAAVYLFGFVAPLASGSALQVASNLGDPSASVAVLGNEVAFGAIDDGDGSYGEDSVLFGAAANQAMSEHQFDTGSLNPVTAVTVSPDQATIYAVLAANYKGTGTTGYTGNYNIGVIACPTSSSTCSPLFQTSNPPSGITTSAIVATAADIYLADYTNGRIVEYALPAGPLSTLVSDGLMLPYMVLDSLYVYWLDSSGESTTVQRAPLHGGGGSESLASVQGVPTGLAISGSTLYVSVNTSSGSSKTGFVYYLPLAPEGGDAGPPTLSGPVSVYSGDPIEGIAAGAGVVLWIDHTATDNKLYAQRVP